MDSAFAVVPSVRGTFHGSVLCFEIGGRQAQTMRVSGDSHTTRGGAGGGSGWGMLNGQPLI
jgi:hypothetical protein